MNLRKYFEQGMLGLLERKDIDNIKVSEIIEEVGSCRGTFYKNYLDKYSLCCTSLQNSVYREICTDVDSWADFIMQCLTAFEKSGKVVLHAFSSKDMNSARHYHEDFTAEYLVKLYNKNGGDSSIALNLLAIKLYSVTVTGIITNWLSEGCKESKEKVLSLICAVAPQMVFNKVLVRSA